MPPKTIFVACPKCGQSAVKIPRRARKDSDLADLPCAGCGYVLSATEARDSLTSATLDVIKKLKTQIRPEK